MENNDLVPDSHNEPYDDSSDHIEYEQNEAIEQNSIDSEKSRQDIFEETFQSLMHPFGEACDEHGTTVSIAIAMHPDHEEPFVFYRAPHIVDAATLMASVLKSIKSQILEDLDTNS